MIRIESIYSFPIKSCGPNILTSCEIREDGLPLDRKYMIVDIHGRFISQREFPILSQIHPTIDEDKMHLKFHESKLSIELDAHSSIEEVQVWSSAVKARRVNPLVDAWLSQILDSQVRLVAYDSVTDRKKLAKDIDQILDLKFTDGYPIHLFSQSSFDDLSKRMSRSISTLRFRPNFILSGLSPYEEERLDTIFGRDFSLKIIKPTGRCKIPNINPKSSESDAEILGELAKYKRSNNSVNFGVYAYSLKPGIVYQGEELKVTYK